MATRRSRRSLDGMCVYNMANLMVKCKSTKNAVPNVPDKVTPEIVALHKGSRCLLQVRQPADGVGFSKK